MRTTPRYRARSALTVGAVAMALRARPSARCGQRATTATARTPTPAAPARPHPGHAAAAVGAQAQFAGYYAAVDQGYYEDEGLDVNDRRGRRRHRPAGRARRRRRRLRHLVGAEGARLDRAGRGHHRRRADLRAQRAPPRSPSRTRTSTSPADLEGQERRQLGLRQRVGALRRHAGRRRRRSRTSTSSSRRST